ncbi:ATP-binding protein [Actinacidiphila yeochonensis]|uniref:ATP-binding protein n=1 Tax=Actinacidiphila yeochonensis TaxID=89050 RepID=UPI00068DD64C|nr:ATP-binding protein [Actinacidiphila yeochonensis]
MGALAFGYLCADVTTPDADLAQAESVLKDYCHRRGFALQRIFTDDDSGPRPEFDDMVATMGVTGTRQVILLDLAHLGRSEVLRDQRIHMLEHTLNAVVMCVGDKIPGEKEAWQNSLASLRNGFAQLTMTASPSSVGVVRSFVADTLHSWRLGEYADVAVLLASELATNAIKSTVEARSTGRLFDVQVRVTVSSLEVRVWDCGAGTPVMKSQVLDAEGGRGLMLVDMLSEDWGTRYDVDRPGKSVWFTMGIVDPVDPDPPGADIPHPSVASAPMKTILAE